MAIAVLGSINMDFVCEVPRLPHQGETLHGSSFARYPGGKGANQAVAAARLGGKVAFFGKVGEDVFGDELLRALRENGVNVDAVERVREASSGIASIWVAQNGENAIIVIPGANSYVDRAYVDQVLPQLLRANVLLLQFEIPLTTITYVLECLPPDGPFVILDPAPAQDISSLPLERIDLLTPNQHELFLLTGEESLLKAGEKLVKLGIDRIVVKAGEQGAFLIEKSNIQHFPGFHVTPVDTTAAGDAFNGALAIALAEGKSLEEAILWANAAGALATTRKGAQPSLPSREEVVKLIASQRPGNVSVLKHPS